MFMSVARPRRDMVSVPGGSSTEGAVLYAAWNLLSSHSIRPSCFLPHHRSELGNVSFNSINQMSGHDKSGPEQPKESSAFLHHGLNIYEDGEFNQRSGSVGNICNGSSLTAGGAYSMLGSTTSPFPPSSPYVSASYTNPRAGWALPSDSNGLITNLNYSIVEPAYCEWQNGPTGVPAHPSTFASSQNSNRWQHHPGSQYRGTDHQMLGYNQNQYYTLGESAVLSPQTSFGSTLTPSHGVRLKAMPEDDELDFINEVPVPSYDSSSSFSSTSASEMMESMMLRDSDSAHSPWTVRGGHLGADSLPCIAGSGGLSPIEQGLSSPSSWDVPTMVSAPQPTVSPKLLRLRPTPTPTSSSESIRTSFLASTGDAIPSQADPFQALRQRATSIAMDIDLPPPATRPRKMLPDRAPRPMQRSSTDSDVNKPSRHPLRDSPLPSLRHVNKMNHKAKPSSPAPRPLPMLSPAPLKPFAPYRANTPTTYTDPEAEERRIKDEFLVEHKQQGMTYKQIRLLGRFTEAESTLRGRYRTLTKSREARVRKPEWSEHDVILLEQGVREYAKDPADPNSHKIPWKKVGEFIAQNGGSYHFGNSTCRKRWDELVREQSGLGRDIRLPFYGQEARSHYGEMGYDDGQMGYGSGTM
ncbi:hypothetical protein QBC44DRAFT_371990 [Cladorrhinum sp. PSN332]|nr:hypothetical protein QBC44DRAFT_371990 [Cladorrhinum sp. PSN332]